MLCSDESSFSWHEVSCDSGKVLLICPHFPATPNGKWMLQAHRASEDPRWRYMGFCPSDVFLFPDPWSQESAWVGINMNTLTLSWHDGEKEMGLLHHCLLVDKTPHPALALSQLALRITNNVGHPSWLSSSLPGFPGPLSLLGFPPVREVHFWAR